MKQRQANSFVRKNITIPIELWPFAEAQAASPLYAGNLSLYVRSLIFRDHEAAAVSEPTNGRRKAR